MAIEIKVPAPGESVSEVTIANWLVKEGDWVEMDAPLAEFESDKATFEVNAEKEGVVEKLIGNIGDTIAINTVIAVINTDAERPAAAAPPAAPAKAADAAPAAPKTFMMGSDTLWQVLVRPTDSVQYHLLALDSNGCLFRDPMWVRVVDPEVVRIPNIITPNGDGDNDFWDLMNCLNTINAV